MRTSSRSLPLVLLVLAAAAGSVGCGNPAVDVQIDALGPETSGVEQGEFHRPGQPCVLCHGRYGGASPEMAIGGTIYGEPTQGDAAGIPVGGATVNLVDTLGSKRSVVTNCAGNFWIPSDDWDPGFPLAVDVVCPTPGATRVMNSRIGRDGSCARCHAGSPNQGSPGLVVCGTSYPAPTPATCPGGVPQ